MRTPLLCSIRFMLDRMSHSSNMSRRKAPFLTRSHRSYSHEIDGAASCPTVELAVAIERNCQDAADISYYIASLILGDVKDVLIRTNETVAFGAPALLSKQNDRELIEATNGALAVGRAVRLLYGRKSLDEILMEHGEPIRAYGETLRMLSTTNSGLWEQIVMRNKDAAGLAGAEDVTPFRHTLSRLDEMLAEGGLGRAPGAGRTVFKTGQPGRGGERPTRAGAMSCEVHRGKRPPVRDWPLSGTCDLSEWGGRGLGSVRDVVNGRRELRRSKGGR